jgi:hypothetical protein
MNLMKKGLHKYAEGLLILLAITQLTACFGFAVKTETDPKGAGVTKIYKDNDKVLIEAVPAPGYVFDHWGGDFQGTMSPIAISPGEASENKKITAFFKKRGLIPAFLPIGQKIGLKKIAVQFEQKYTNIQGASLCNELP